ncbi:MAG TPA: DNA recombination protein RmuC [Gemmatimonadaceae bacterium]|nr:DNA recombination protein RmuC [Gemmatimonadaceae bacterium]
MSPILAITALIAFVAGSLGTYLICRARLATARTETRSAQAWSTDLERRLNQRIAQQDAELKTLRERLTTMTADDATQRTRVAELERLHRQLQDVFASLSADALKSNNEAFLQLARTELERVRAEAKGDIEKSGKSIEDLLTPIREGLKAYDDKLAVIEKDRARTFGEMTQRLQQVGDASDTLKAETRNLVDALRTPAARGRWGEFHLQRVCEMAGMLQYCDFDTQKSVQTEEGRIRPDLVVRLAGGKSIVVDSKVPGDAYEAAMAASDEEGRCALLKKHAEHVRARIVELSRKAYWEQFDPTPGLVVLFLPGDMLFYAALQQDPTLIEFGADRNVLLATPTSLIAMLRAIALGWQQESIAESAEEISRLAKELYERLASFDGHLERMGRNLKSAVEAYNSGIGSLEARVLVTARKLHAQGAFPGDEIAVLSPVEVRPRALQAPEYLPASRASGTTE